MEPATVSLSLENPETRIGTGHGSGDLEGLYPDVVAKVALSGSRVGADLAGLMRFLRSDRGGVEEVAVAGGGAVNARINTFGKDAPFVRLMMVAHYFVAREVTISRQPQRLRHRYLPRSSAS